MLLYSKRLQSVLISALGLAACLLAVAIWQPDWLRADAAQGRGEHLAALESPDPRTGASEAQLAALADGTVTREEYVAAVDTAAACLRDAGIEGIVVDGPTWQGDRYQYSFSAPSRDVGDQANDVYERCHVEHERAVVIGWASRNYEPPSAEEVAALYREIGACYRDSGVDVPEQPEFLELQEAAQAADRPGLYATCYQAAAK